MKKTFTLKVLIHFFDTEAGFKRLRNSEFECSDKRAKEILDYEKSVLVEILSIIKK